MLTPLDIEREFGLSEGNIFQGELTLEQLFFLRPAPGWADYRTPLKRLYMCGSATHPGGGIMGAPGRNAAMRVLKGMTDVVVIGAGVNGLVAGAWLAKQKLETIILDAREAAGGAAITSELAPGFSVPALSHALGPIAREVVRALHLDRAGIEFITPNPMLTTLGGGEDAIVFHRDPVLTAQSINLVSPGDAGRWSEFERTTQRLGAVMNLVHREIPPAIDGMPARDLWRWLMVGRRARALGRRDLARLMRWVPMSIADVTGEWFEHGLLQAAIAAHAIFGNPAGPRSAGTGGMWLQRLGADPMPVGSGVTARGGPGAVAHALAGIATKAGAKVRLASRVARIQTQHGRVTGVVLASGDEIPARAVVCAIDPRQAFVDLVDPMDLPASFLERMRHYRVRGVTAKINLALSGMPAFTALGGDAAPASRPLPHRARSRLPRARVRRDEIRRPIAAAVARAVDSVDDRPGAGAGSSST